MADVGFSDLLSVVQTIAIISALLVTLYFSRRQIQALAMDLETRVLNDLDEKFHRIGEIFIERPDFVRTIYDTPNVPRVEVAFGYYIVFFCAHIFHMHERGVLRDNEWIGWLKWMQNAFQFGTIRKSWTEEGINNWVDPAFRDFVARELLRPGDTRSTSASDASDPSNR